MDNNNMYNQDTQQPYQQQPYQQPQFQQQPYQQPPYQAPMGDLEEPVSFGEWMLTLLIMMIPCVNLVMLFVWGFGSGAKKSKSNFCKAQLVWMLIFVVLYIVLIAVLGVSIFSAIGESTYSYY